MDLGNVVLGALLIFAVRVFGITLSTVRLLLLSRASRIIVGSIAFIEALTFALTFSQVLSDLSNIWYLTAYCLGFAVGTIVGLFLEERLAAGFVTVNIVSMTRSQKVAEAIREAGFGAMRSSGEGASGTVGWVRSVVRRRDMPAVIQVAQSADPRAFVTVEETRSVRHGYLGLYRS